jgi:hypothetical protein
MKTRFPSILGVFAAILMVASFVIPVNIAAPSAVSADPGIMKWDTVITPNSVVGMNDVLNTHALGANTGQGNEILSMAVGNDGMTVCCIVRQWITAGYVNTFMYSNLAGITFTITRWFALIRKSNWPLNAVLVAAFNAASPGAGTALGPYLSTNLYQVAIAPDDPKFIAVTSDNPGQTPPFTSGPGPKMIWVTTDAGQNWDLAYDGTTILGVDETIRNLDISIDYGGKRDLAFVTTGTAGGRFTVRASTGFTGWLDQLNADGTAAGRDGAAWYQAVKFSPTYNGDSAITLVYATADATYFQVALRDLNQNTTLQYAYGGNGIEVKNPASPTLSSPGAAQLNNVCLQLPSDFSGQSSSLRRAYVSLDAYNSGNTTPPTKLAGNEDGIYRIDDTTTYVLNDTTSIVDKSFYSIAYFGTYASGKLLGGERMGYPCLADVPTWFTDSPTTCPIPCWYPALKGTTGAANQGTCIVGAKNGLGGAIVGWNADGSLGLVATGSVPWGVYNTEMVVEGKGVEKPGTDATLAAYGIASSPMNWFVPAFGYYAAGTAYMGIGSARDNDENAFAISRNNGETWNQLSLIDTTIDWFNDVAVSPDCTTIYLASVNRNTGAAGMCNEFDSVWRSTLNPNVAAPLFAVPPIGTYWERVFTHTTSGSCNVAQSDLPILRVVESCTDKKDGEIVAWAAEDAFASTSNTGGVLAWSPDFGDYWAVVTPRDPVRDFAFESSTIVYTLSPIGLVQRLPYTGTAWSTNLPSYDTTLGYGHTIAAMPDGKVLTGGGLGSAYPASYSSNAGVLFTLLSVGLSGHGNEHVIFDVDFKNNQFIYMGDDAAGGVMGTVYRNTLPSFTKWNDNDMMSVANGASGIDWNGILVTIPGLPSPIPPIVNPPHPVGIFGLVQAWTGASPNGTIPYGPALYAAHDPAERFDPEGCNSPRGEWRRETRQRASAN